MVQLPPGSRVVASSAFCEYAALLYDDSILTFQGHPEFSIEYEIDLINLRCPTVFPVERAEPALQRLKQKGASEDGTILSGWAADLLRRNNKS